MTHFPRTFDGLTELMSRHRALWAESAFLQNRLSWQTDYPRLYDELLALSEAELEVLEREEVLLAFLSAHIPELKTLTDAPLATSTVRHWQASDPFAVPQRKRMQIEGFVSALLDAEMAAESCVLDWCSGRGHLARAIHAATGSRVLCLEHDAKLHRHDLPSQVTFLAHDVLKPLGQTYLRDFGLHTALHACGDLHLSMLRQTTSAGVARLAFSPCCYHFTTEQVYEGLSRQARESALRPSRDQLRLATAETTTANTLDRKLRHRELLWRVAFDLHLRELRQVDAYSRIPSVRKSLLKTDFNTFAEVLVEALERRGRRDFDFSPLGERAEADLMGRAQTKLSVVLRMEKAQLAFRLVMERWLLLDRALYLQENGYEVEIRRFCAKVDSGRNQVILARAK